MKKFNAKTLLLGVAVGLVPTLFGAFGPVTTNDLRAQQPRLNPGRRAPMDPAQPKASADAEKAGRARLNPMHPGPVKPGQEGMTGDVSPEAVEGAEKARRARLNPMHPGPVKPGQEGMTGDVSPEAVEAASGDVHDRRPGRPGAMHNIKREFPGASEQWRDGFTRDWIAEEKERHHIKPIADNKAIATMTDSQREGDTYGNYTEADVALWEAETERLVVEGSRIFHSADLLGSTNGTSCDMCHPDGEGTHAETYPKYQVQLGRAALLRDMANWCLENPCRAEPMSGDDARMRALEAYMQAQRTGKPMKYGKH